MNPPVNALGSAFAAIAPPPPGLDEVCFRAVYAGPAGGPWFSVMLALTVVGGGWAMLALLPLLFFDRTRAMAKILTMTLLSTGFVVFAMKLIVRRVRPCSAIDGITASITRPTDFSFPSGHAAGSFTVAAFFATVLIAQHRKTHPRDRHPQAFIFVTIVSALLVATAASVALSRVYLGVHFPGDVTAGAVLGSTFGTLGALRYIGRWETARKPTAT